MRHRYHVAALGLALACAGHPDARSGRESAHVDATARHPDSATGENLASDSLRVPRAPLVKRPAELRGLYVNRWAALGDRMWKLIDLADRTR